MPGGVTPQKESLNGGLSLVSTHVQRESDAMRASEQLDYLFGDQRNQRRDLERDLGAHERRQAVAKAIDLKVARVKVALEGVRAAVARMAAARRGRRGRPLARGLDGGEGCAEGGGGESRRGGGRGG